MAQRYDIGTLQPVQRRPDGTIIADALLTRCGIFEYADSDSPTGIRRELRLPEEVSDPASLATLLGRPVTNDHPAGMVDSTCATEYAVGGVAEPARMDDDHVRSRLSVWDQKTVGDMERGKRDVSLGYTCDVEEKSGTHPIWGDFDCIQRNIRYNHAAIVDMGRAGTARARMDGMSLGPSSGTALASRNALRHTAEAMAGTARIDVVVRTDKGEPSASAVVDPDDLASRNAAGKTQAPKAPKEPAQFTDSDEGDDDCMDGDPEDGGEAHKPDAYDSSYDDEGELTAEARNKIKASNFAVPDKEKLPIHDKPHVRAAMSRFGQTDFESPDEKHGAFNRIKSKAKQFGIATEGFEKSHAGKLDKRDNTMNDAQIKALQEKADRRKAQRDEARTKCDAADAKVKEQEATIATLTAQVEDLKTAKAKADEAAKTHADAADDKFAERVDAKVALLAQARATGAEVDAKMSDRAIKCAVIKHVSKVDIDDKKHEAYVDAKFEGALDAHKADAKATADGANAIAGARAAVVNQDPVAKNDAADDTDEEAAARRLRTATATAYQQPGRTSKKGN